MARNWRKGRKEGHEVSFWGDNKVALVSGDGRTTL